MIAVWLGKILWLLGVAGWCAIRYGPYRRARRTATATELDRSREWILLGISFAGMFVMPLVYVASSQPRFANYAVAPIQIALGAVACVVSMWLFYRTHKDLGSNWSATLEVRDRHTLVTTGIYGSVRHPMYAAFWLWTLAQALLLANWIAGLAGLMAFGLHFLMRIDREERMMIDRFGDAYVAYMAQTSRIIPGLY
jgi:protein-S-isoprenylcysteine O-methyltransferase Ste14